MSNLFKKENFEGIKRNFKRWLRKRTHRRYNYSRLDRYVSGIAFGAAISIIALIYVYLNSHNFNSENWAINFGGILLLVAAFFSIKYSWRLIVEIGNWFKRQRNWLKYSLTILMLLLAWEAYENRTEYLDPKIDYIKNIDYSPFNPLNMEKTSELLEKVADTTSEVYDDVSDTVSESLSSKPSYSQKDLEMEVYRLINDERVANGLSRHHRKLRK